MAFREKTRWNLQNLPNGWKLHMELGGAGISGFYNKSNLVEESVLERKVLHSVQGLLSLGPLWEIHIEITDGTH